MATRIDTVASRDKLKPRREPYWHRLRRGCYLGFHKMTSDGAGVWVARARDEEAGPTRHVYESLGDFGALPDHQPEGRQAVRQALRHAARGDGRGDRLVNLLQPSQTSLHVGLCQPDAVRGKLARGPVKTSRVIEWLWTTSIRGKISRK